MGGRTVGEVVTVLCLLCVFSSVEGQTIYEQTEIWEGWSFFDNFYFFSDPDPTHGYVYYTTHDEALDWGLIQINPKNQILIQPDSWSISSGSGRASVRLQSYQQWTSGPLSSYLFILDLDHMPTGCGTWPSWWMCGPNWPSGGEIDILEGVNVNTENQITLHTSTGCTMNNDPPSSFTGTLTTPNCAYQPGCTITNSGNYGTTLNTNNGGIYATQYNQTSISVWFFERNNIPSDLFENSTKADPGGWGEPAAFFPLGGDCPSSHFHDLNIIFDLTFCGDWAGNAFASACPGKGSCQNFVQNNPSAFEDAYWLINFLKVMQA